MGARPRLTKSPQRPLTRRGAKGARLLGEARKKRAPFFSKARGSLAEEPANREIEFPSEAAAASREAFEPPKTDLAEQNEPAAGEVLEAKTAADSDTGKATPIGEPLPPQSSDTAPLSPGAAPKEIAISSDQAPARAGAGTGLDVAVELPPLAPPPALEKPAAIEDLRLDGSSDAAMVGFTNARPSQMAQAFPTLGPKLNEKLGAEKQSTADAAPLLEAKLNGKVDAGITAPGELPTPANQQDSPPTASATPELTPNPHLNRGKSPTGAAELRELEAQSPATFFEWLRAQVDKLFGRIRTRDDGVNTSAGPRPAVKLDAEANPEQIGDEGLKSEEQIGGHRDTLTDSLKQNPGQHNIQARSVAEERKPVVNTEADAQLTTSPEEGMAAYVAAPLAEDVRAKADDLLAPKLQAGLQETRDKTVQAAATRDQDKKSEIDHSNSEAARINQEADGQQRAVVLDNRKKVAEQQTLGIREAHADADSFRREAGDKQKGSRKEISDHVKTAEGAARKELDQAELDAENKRLEGERQAAAKKKAAKKKKKKKSWWRRAAGAVMSAFKALAKVITKIFNKIRAAVKFLIDKAKKAAIGLINKARNWVVNKLNQFRKWAKDKVNTYLKERFPALAKRINGAIDSLVDTAITGVNKVADAAIAGVEALANALGKILDKILATFQTVVTSTILIAGAVLTGDLAEALRVAVQAACEIAGIDSKPIFDFIDRAAAQVVAILKHPVRFFNNLVGAVGAGARNFIKNLPKHLVAGVVGWLTGALSEVQIKIPETFDLKAAFSLVRQILGLTYENIKARVIQKFPKAAPIIERVEKGIAIVARLAKEGPMGLWEEIQQSAADLKERILGDVRLYVIKTVAKEAIGWLLGLLNPAGALVKVVKLLFDFAMFLVKRWQQIKEFVESVYNTLADMAAGNFAKVTKGVEDAMARSLPVLISLLARLAGLGGIGQTVKDIVRKVSTPVNRVVDRIIDKMVEFAKKLLKTAKTAGKKAIGAVLGWWKLRVPFKTKKGIQHTLLFKGGGKSSRLAVRSKETLYQDFLAGIDRSGFSDAKKAAYTEAKNKAAAVDAARAKRITATDKEAKKRAQKEKQEHIETLLESLRAATAVLMDVDLPHSKAPKWQGVDAASGFGGWMHAERLTMNGLPQGSPPSKAKHGTYDVLDKRRTSGGSASYYIRGHLLNDNLGGPGKWINMTPLSRSGNSKHEKSVETFAKAAVRAGGIVEYKVSPQKGSRARGGDFHQKLVQGRSDEDAKTLSEIVAAEQHVPASLSITLVAKEPVGLKPVSYPVAPTVPNPIEHNDPDSYHLAKDEKFDPIDINQLSTQAKLEAKHLPKELRDAAKSIFNAASNQHFSNYDQLANKTKPKADLLRKWRDLGLIKLGKKS